MNPDFSDLVDGVFDEGMLNQFYAGTIHQRTDFYKALTDFLVELKLEFRYHPSMDLEMIFRSTIKKVQYPSQPNPHKAGGYLTNSLKQTQGAYYLLLKRIEALNKCKPMADIVGGQG